MAQETQWTRGPRLVKAMHELFAPNNPKHIEAPQGIERHQPARTRLGGRRGLGRGSWSVAHSKQVGRAYGQNRQEVKKAGPFLWRCIRSPTSAALRPSQTQQPDERQDFPPGTGGDRWRNLSAIRFSSLLRRCPVLNPLDILVVQLDPAIGEWGRIGNPHPTCARVLPLLDL